MNLQEVKEALWYHSYGVDGVKHLNKAQYFEIENDNKIDFKKGISWFGLVSFDNYEQESDQCYILQMELWKNHMSHLALYMTLKAMKSNLSSNTKMQHMNWQTNLNQKSHGEP